MLNGIDVSGADVDWARVRQSGAVFGGFKLSEGQDFRHARATRARYVAIHRAGLFVIAYHFLRPKPRDPTLEMRFYLRCLRSLGYPSKGDLPPVIDIETTELGPAATRAYLETAARFLLAKGTHPRGIMIYGSPAFLDSISVGDSRFLSRKTARGQVKWWIAHQGPPPGTPRLPRGVGRFFIHQHALDTTCSGVTGDCDKNVVRPGVNLAKLKRIAFLRGAPTPNPPPQPSPPNDRTRLVQQLLLQIGWPITVNGQLDAQTKQAIRDFKRGYAFTPDFRALDASTGPALIRRLQISADLGEACSDHFKFREFASSRSRWIRTHRDLMRGLEKLRREINRPIAVLSGFRDFNLGASRSQHLFGNAIDPTVRLPLDACLRVRAFSGIGRQPGTREVRHVDVRHVGPNFTGGTLANPTVFDDTF